MDRQGAVVMNFIGSLLMEAEGTAAPIAGTNKLLFRLFQEALPWD